MRFRVASVLLFAALLASCGRGDDARNAGAPNGAIVPDDIVPDDAIDNVALAPNAAAPALPGAPDGPLDRLAGVTVGARLADLRAAGFDVTLDPGPDPDDRCGYARIKGREALFVMLDGETVVRIDVAAPGQAALGGVAVGMSQAEALRRLGPRAAARPNPQAGSPSRLLVVHEEGAPFGFIAETDGTSVVSYRLGRWAAVRSTESCL